MLRSKRLVGLVLVATLMAALVPFSATVYAQNQEGKKAERFLALAEQSKELVESLTEFVEAQSIDVPEEAITLYETGSASLEQALTAFNEGDYEGAIELAKEALWNFREAIKVLNKALEPIEEEIEAESEHSALGEAIARAGDRITRVVGIIEAMIESYPALRDILTEIEETLEVAEEHLATADEYLAETPPDVDAAAKELGEARRLISSAFVSLKKHVTGALNSGRTKGFLTVISKFYDRVARWVEREGLAEEFGEELDNIQNLIEEAKTKDPETEFDEIVANLLEARIRLESIQEEIRETRKGGPKGG